jgi:two-component system response regulator YesN
MGETKVVNGIEFDLNKAIKCAVDYAKSIGTGCMVINLHGELLYKESPQNTICSLCKELRLSRDGDYNCQNTHLYGAYQAERFGGKYVYFCSLGLVHWSSPIMNNGVMCGALVGGPALMMDPNEFLLYDIINMDRINPQGVNSIKKHIKEIPIFKPEKVNSLSELLFTVATNITGIADSGALKSEEDKEDQEQLFNISMYLGYIKTMGGDVNNPTEYPLGKERELLSLVSQGDKAASQKILNEILGYIFFSSNGNFDVIKSRVLELIVLLSRAALEGGADVEQIFGMNYRFLNQIHDFKSIDELTYWLSNIMTRFTDCVFNLTDNKHVDVIYKAIDYIKHNYMKKITLEEVSSHVYLSASYFSKVFNDEMKCNFNAYLNKIRIEVSKNLLMDKSLSLIDISNLIGYEDQSYFNKVFKKATGISPGHYRETRGKAKVINI